MCITFSILLFTTPYALGQLQEHLIDIVPGASNPNNENGFSPKTVSVNAGTVVTWVNKDNTTHTVTFATAGIYDSGLIAPAKNVTHAFVDQGTFNYFCRIHPFMTGSITIS